MRSEGKTASGFLALAGGKINRLDARLLLQEICGLSHAKLIAEPESILSSEHWLQLESLLERRTAGEPLAYLLGHAEFRGHRFKITPDVLIPRPETEELVSQALSLLTPHPSPLTATRTARCVDLGTGSGIIAISLKLEYPQTEIHAVDVSEAALAVAHGNARQLGTDIKFYQGSWYAPLAGQRFDLIVANPPYVAAGDPHLVLNGLPHEPQMALTDGADGLECIRAIVSGAAQHLLSGGWLLFEHGYDQAEAARDLLATAGFQAVFSKTDLAGIDRISGGQMP